MDPMSSPRVNGPMPPSMAASGRAPARPPPAMGGGPSELPPKPAGPGPDDLAARIEAEIPEPKDTGYSPKVLAEIEDSLREAWAEVRGVFPSLPELPAGALLGGYSGEGKLPLTLMVPVLLLSDLAVSLGGGAGKRYAIDPATLVDDKALRRVLAQLRVMCDDKKLYKALEEAGGPKEPDTEEAPVGGKMKEPPPIPKGVRAGL